jgi:hypothetical protein
VRRGLALLALLALPAPSPAAAADEPGVLAVRLTSLDFRPALRILTAEGVKAGVVAREGDFVVIRVAANAAAELPLPPVEKPLEGIAVEREPGQTTVRVKVAPEVPFETSFEPGLLTVVFGEQPPPELRGPVTPDLYKQLFPGGIEPSGSHEEQPEGRGAGAAEGILVGPVTLRPYVSASWVDADIAAFDNPTPTRDQYLQVTPGVTASMPFFTGLLAAEYEPRLRFFSKIPQVNDTSQFAGAKIEMPVGSRALVRLSHRFTRAVVETNVVDPGREYFFNLAPYTFNATDLGGRIDISARLFAEAQADWQWSRFDQSQSAGFFSYDSRAIRVGLGYDVGSDLKAVVSYSYERIPPAPDREIVETTSHSLLGTLAGTIAPLTSGSVTVGLLHQTNPLATGKSHSFDGVTLAGTLRRELGHASSVALDLTRASNPSGFETNAYYVNNSVVVSLTVPAPFETWARSSLGWLRNGYPNDASVLGAPRRDDIVAWTVGLGRQLGWRAWLRADYRRERRNSNLPGYDTTTDGVIVQLGVGLFGPAGSARP